MIRFLTRCYAFFVRKPRLFWGIGLSLCVLLAAVASRIQFKEDISTFLPQSPETEWANFVFLNNKLSDKMIFKLSLKDTLTTDDDALMTFAETWAHQLEELVGEELKEVKCRVDNESIAQVQASIQALMPFYLAEKDWATMDEKTSPAAVKKAMRINHQMMLMPSSFVMKESVVNDPLHLSLPVLEKIRKIGDFQNFEMVDGYFFSKDHRAVFVFALSNFAVSDTKNNKQLLLKIRQAQADFQQNTLPSPQITYFSAAEVAVGNASQIKQDSLIATIVVVLLIGGLLFSYFRSVYALLLILLPVGFGGLLAIACMVLFKGSVSLIAIGAASVMVGIAVNYALHFLVHDREMESSEATLKDIAFPMIVGSVTTVGAFLSLTFVKSDALQDFGWFSALTLLGTLAVVLLAFPFLLRNKRSKQRPYGGKQWEKIADAKALNKPVVTLLLIAATVVLACFSSKVRFESDFTQLNYMNKEQKEALNEISQLAQINQPYLYHVACGKNLEEALQVYEKARLVIDSLQEQGCFHRIQGIGDFLPSQQRCQQRLHRWETFCKAHGTSLRADLEKEAQNNGFRQGSFAPFLDLLETKKGPTDADFEVLRMALLDDYLIETPDRAAVITLLYPKEGVDEILASPLAKVENTLLFNRQMSNQSMVDLLYQDFNWVLLVCASLVFLFLLLSFGRIELALTAMMPMILGWIWILGWMAIFDIRFNIINIILATFIFGLGDDYSIFMMEGLMKEYARKKKLLRSYKVAVLLSALTLFIGIGVLILGKHPAMRSLAQVSIIGMISVVVMSYTISPRLFRFLTEKNGRARRTPLTLKNYAITLLAFFCFLMGCLFLHLLLPFFCIPWTSRRKRKYYYHQVLSKISRFVSQSIPLVDFECRGYDPHKFEKPAILIANHQSHLDLTCLIGLNPKIIVLTNRWVWNMPFYALPLRFVDFCPVANGLENALPHLAQRIEEGYSILVFPEGTRSESGTIQRFHKGAFFLAEHFKLDILPLMIHGLNHVLPKRELLLNSGKISVEILERHTYDECLALGSLSQQAKFFRRSMQERFQTVSQRVETPQYWIKYCRQQYAYKGAEIAWEVRKNLRDANALAQEIARMQKCKSVLIQHCGYGERALCAAWVCKDTQFVATDSREDFLEVAQHLQNLPPNLHFVKSTDAQDLEINYDLKMSYE